MNLTTLGIIGGAVFLWNQSRRGSATTSAGGGGGGGAADSGGNWLSRYIDEQRKRAGEYAQKKADEEAESLADTLVDWVKGVGDGEGD